MSIEVEVSLSRKTAVFLTGESFVVKITLSNNSTDTERSLAWGCVQLHCEQQNVAGSGTGTDTRRHTNRTTAVTRAKQAIFSSEPTILFCDIRIGLGAVRQFETLEEIPLELPPSFKGHFMKYLWYVSVATQQVDAPIKVGGAIYGKCTVWIDIGNWLLVQLPIKVFNVGIDVSTANVPAMSPIGENPFLSKDIKSPSIVELAVSRIEEICSVRKQRCYEIKSGGRLIATVVLFRNVFKLGDDVVGRLEFAQDELHCLQALVRAEIVETNLLDDGLLNREESVKKATAAPNGGTDGTSHVHTFGTEHMVTAMVRETHFKLQLPMSAVPSFTTETVKVRWRLRFEFVTTAQQVMVEDPQHQKGGSGTLRTLADDLNIETMKWEVPIAVLSCNPFNAGLISAQPSTTTFNI